MIRTIAIDFNHKGIAKHEVYTVVDREDDFTILPNQIIENYKRSKASDIELVGITEICDETFNPKDLKNVVTSAELKGHLLILWYVNTSAGLKTLWQERDTNIC